MNLLQEGAAFSTAITKAALHIATGAHAVAAVGVIGTAATAMAAHQPLLHAAFGGDRGALLTLASIALGALATQVTAHGQPIGATASASVVNVTAVGAAVDPAFSAAPTTKGS